MKIWSSLKNVYDTIANEKKITEYYIFHDCDLWKLYLLI